MYNEEEFIMEKPTHQKESDLQTIERYADSRWQTIGELAGKITANLGSADNGLNDKQLMHQIISDAGHPALGEWIKDNPEWPFAEIPVPPHVASDILGGIDAGGAEAPEGSLGDRLSPEEEPAPPEGSLSVGFAASNFLSLAPKKAIQLASSLGCEIISVGSSLYFWQSGVDRMAQHLNE